MKHYPSTLGDLYLGEDPEEMYAIFREMSHSGCYVIVDSNTNEKCLPLVPGIRPARVITIPAGEANKNMEQCAAIWSQLIESGADRESLIINLGGGVVCDLGGFAASCFQRGIRFLHFPTTVTAMTDAAIGGKLGVDFKDYKNYVGLFNAPVWIWVNPVFIRTLSTSEVRSGLTEIIKHAIIGSRPLWEKLQCLKDIEEIDWTDLLELSIKVKLEVIETDPLDRAGRKTLNFGHTIGHALESHFLHTRTPLSHGQAVALGMMAESKMAVDIGMLAEKTFEQIVSLIHRLIQPPDVAIPGVDELNTWIMRDKKMEYGMPSYSLPDKIGSCLWDIRTPDPALALDWLRGHVSGAAHRFIRDSY